MLTKSCLTLRLSPPVASTPLSLSPVRLCFGPYNSNNSKNSNDNKLLFSSSTCVNRKLAVLSFTPNVANNSAPLSHSSSYHLNSLRNLETRVTTTSPFVANNNKSITNSSCSSLECSSIVSNFSEKCIEIKNNIIQVLAPLLLFGIFAVMCTPYLQVSAAYASSLSSSSSDSKEEADTSRPPFAKFRRRKPRRLNKSRVSPVNQNESLCTIISSDESPCKDLCVKMITTDLPSSSSNTNTTAGCDTNTNQSSSGSFLNFKNILPSPLAETIEDIVFITLVLFSIPLALSLISGFRYFLQLCKRDKKTILMMQVGVLDKMRELRRQLAQIEDESNSDDLKLKEVVKALLQHYNSCHFAYVSAIQCLSDEEIKYGDIFAEMMRSISDDPPALVKAYRVFKFYVKSFAIFIHWGLKKVSKKIKYGNQCAKQLFGELLSKELVRYDRDEKTSVTIDVDDKEAAGSTKSMVHRDYTVVTILVLASGKYSILPLVCNTEHVKTVLQKLNTIAKSEIEALEVFWTAQREDEGVSEQELQRDFPLLKPVKSGLEG